jgi:YD repeat-containing protein
VAVPRLAPIAVLAGALWLAASPSAQAPVRYIYDELGRLVGVIDTSGDAAVYHYDPVGNLLGISRVTSTQVSVIEFSPDAGPVGQPVTIYGTGFSATTGQNSVSFNGTSASIVSASTTMLVVTVPSGAATGTIGVTSPNGADTSVTSFTVTAPDAPTITSFSPTSGLAGTSVTITGTNFETTAAHNQTRFNSTATSPTAATGTTVTAPVPAATGSGRITVKTPVGTAVSADDFIIPPPPYVVSDVATADRLAFASATAVTISTASKIGLRLFDGVFGQRVALLGTNGLSGQYVGCDVNVSILNPFTTVVAPPTCMEGTYGFIDTRTLNVAGTYTILVDPATTATGSVTLTLYDVPADFTSSITPGGAAVTATMSTPGQNGRLTFSGSSGQRISILGTNGMSGQVGLVCDVSVTVIEPDGSELAPAACMESNGYLDVQTLPTTGTYTILVDPAEYATGSLTVTLHDVPADFTSSITPGGSAVTATMPVSGQKGLLTFSGTAGQRISLLGTNGLTGYILGCDVHVSIRTPEDSVLAQPTCMEGSGGFIDVKTLPANGTYTIVVDPVEHAFGNLTLTLFDVPADFSSTITPGGSAVTAMMPVHGQNGSLTFSGTAGQRISLRGTNGLSGYILGCDVNVSIRNPDTSVLAANTCMEGTNGGFIDTRVLPATGTYTIVVDPVNHAIGNVTLTQYDVPADTTGSIAIGGSAVAVPLGTPGQNGTLTFSGTASQQVTVRMTSNTFGWVTVRVLKPDGSQLTSAMTFTSSFNLSTQTLPSTGTYTIVVDPRDHNTGSVNVNITNP